MSLSIIIPSRNLSNLRQCVAAIRAHEQERHRIIVVWDGPVFKEFVGPGGKVDIDQMEFGAERFCFGRNVNIGISAAGTDDVLVMNDDALVMEGDFSGAVKATQLCSVKAGLLSMAVTGYPNVASPVTSPWVRPWARLLTNAKMLPFVAVLIPRTTIDEVGLLDEVFCGTVKNMGTTIFSPPPEYEVYGGEDDSYCYRVRKAALSLGIYDGCVVDHATLPSTFRPDGKGRSTMGARIRFQELHGFPMGSK